MIIDAHMYSGKQTIYFISEESGYFQIFVSIL
jgi:hypothetical protein